MVWVSSFWFGCHVFEWHPIQIVLRTRTRIGVQVVRNGISCIRIGASGVRNGFPQLFFGLGVMKMVWVSYVFMTPKPCLCARIEALGVRNGVPNLQMVWVSWEWFGCHVLSWHLRRFNACRGTRYGFFVLFHLVVFKNIYKAHRDGELIHIFYTSSRPNVSGGQISSSIQGL